MSDFALFGHDLFGEPVRLAGRGPLAERFEFPPFSVLDGRSGEWQQRKDAWRALGLQGELGRKEDLGVARWGANWMEKHGDGAKRSTNGTGVFDPVLCELAYRWFCPPGGQVLDPFAGGSVRGIVAGLLGYRYYGIDLRDEQIAANEEQRRTIAPDAPIAWVCGDSLDALAEAPEADFVFSCPPYGDLERYSDDPRDLSTQEYHTFLANYRRIILRAYQRLKADRLACFVVGDFRDRRTGMYRGFVADTINSFRDIGMPLYNDVVLLQATGTAAMRAAGYMSASRKVVKLHQNVLVFAKGNPKRAFDGECAA